MCSTNWDTWAIPTSDYWTGLRLRHVPGNGDHRIRQWYDENRESCRFGEDDLCRKILANVIGLTSTRWPSWLPGPLPDCHPRLDRARDSVEIPVYLCDSILTPSEYGGLLAGGALGKAKELKTAASNFLIPTEIAGPSGTHSKVRGTIGILCPQRIPPSDFLARCRDEGYP